MVKQSIFGALGCEEEVVGHASCSSALCSLLLERDLRSEIDIEEDRSIDRFRLLYGMVWCRE